MVVTRTKSSSFRINYLLKRLNDVALKWSPVSISRQETLCFVFLITCICIISLKHIQPHTPTPPHSHTTSPYTNPPTPPHTNPQTKTYQEGCHGGSISGSFYWYFELTFLVGQVNIQTAPLSPAGQLKSICPENIHSYMYVISESPGQRIWTLVTTRKKKSFELNLFKISHFLNIVVAVSASISVKGWLLHAFCP